MLIVDTATTGDGDGAEVVEVTVVDSPWESLRASKRGRIPVGELAGEQAGPKRCRQQTGGRIMYVMAWIFTLVGCVLLLNTIIHIDTISGSAARQGVVATYFTQALIAFGVGSLLFGIAGLRRRVERLHSHASSARNADGTPESQ